MYDNILLPTDGSGGMEGVIDHAVSLAQEHDATIHGVYVVETASFANLPMESSMERVGESLRREGQRALATLEANAEEVDLETTIVEGSPARVITSLADEWDCDLVVMGTHGRSGVDRLLLGSVAERIVRSSQVPVLTVRVSESEVPEEEEEPPSAE